MPVSRLGIQVAADLFRRTLTAAGDSVFEHISGHMTGARYGREGQLFNQKSDTLETP